MTKDKRIQIRIKEAEISYLRENLPPEVENISELMRAAALNAVKNQSLGAASGGVGISDFSEIITENTERIIFEVQQNRALVTAIQKVVQQQHDEDANKLRTEMINDLINWYLGNQDDLKTFDDLHSVEDPFLREVTKEAVDELVKRGLITMKPSGRIVWHG